MCVLWYVITAHSHIRGATTGAGCLYGSCWCDYQRRWANINVWCHDERYPVEVGVGGVGGNFLDLMAQMSMPIYSFHGLFTRGSLHRMADNIGLVDPIDDFTGVCTAIYPYATTILIDCIIIDNCKKIVVSEETGVGDLLSGRHWPIATRQC